MTKPTYAVGYAKPPAKSQFKAGASGNPKGRRKGVKNFATEVAEELAETLIVTEGGKPRKVTKQRAMVKALFAKSMKGDARTASLLLALIPNAEKALKEAVQSHSLTEMDEDILAAFRERVVQELVVKPEGDPHGQ